MHHHRSARKVAVLGAFALAATVLTGSASADERRAGDSSEQIVVTEQASDQILVLRSEHAAWDTADVSWSWKPTDENGLGHLGDSWGAPSDAKLRHATLRNKDEAAYLLTTDSLGLAAVVPYPEGNDAYWYVDLGPTPNLHSIELLPDGNVALAASRGDWVRIYTASQGQTSKQYVEFSLDSAHGVHWDERRNLLWAIGGDRLVALRVGGTPAQPVLTKVRDNALPTPAGHDLQPVASDPDRLWVTTDEAVYQYSVQQAKFLQDYPGAGEISRPYVKAVGDERNSGQVLTSAVQPGNICTWCTDTVNLFQQSQDLTLRGTQIYKARWWVDPNRD